MEKEKEKEGGAESAWAGTRTVLVQSIALFEGAAGAVEPTPVPEIPVLVVRERWEKEEAKAKEKEKEKEREEEGRVWVRRPRYTQEGGYSSASNAYWRPSASLRLPLPPAQEAARRR
jgi:hypothetical protein